MVLWYAQNISYKMNIMTANFHVKNCVKYALPPPFRTMWNGIENFHVK